MDFNNVTYQAINSFTTREGQTPNIVSALWKVWTNPEVISEWVQPTGAHDAYRLNDLVLYNNQTWKCISDYCVYAPGVFGWEVSE